ncbi:hypothetical protein LSTR_LSTR008079 [Laodelphax striatellus]|uniref:Uncharacterized protein n=1 Tax=Laodelphax striatellus TaxID=195883 RepID=A0A482X785_LAOST|nr:hypothetical protein LSTR_LSTR008079 [Laodelphax striatellus]
MVSEVSFHSLLLVACYLLLSSTQARSTDGRLERRQLDFDSVNENADVPVFGRRISSLTKKKQDHLPVSSPDSQSDGSAPDRNYLPGKEYLPPPSAQPPKLSNIINIEPPFGSSDQVNNAINYTPEPERTTKAVTKRIKVPIPRVKTTTEGYPNIEPAAAGNAPNLIQPVTENHENHSLERLCNDPFHSFLCTGATKQRERITGRLRPQAKIPQNVLNGQASFQNERKSPPSRPIEPSPSRDFPSFIKPSTTKPSPTTTEKQPVFKGFDTQPTSDFRAYLPPSKVSSKPEKSYDTQAASDSKAYLPPTETPVQPQPSFESRDYLPPVKPASSDIFQQRKQFSTQPKSFKSFSQSQASSNNFYNFPVSSTLKPIVVNKVNPTVKTVQYTTQKPPVFPQFNNYFSGQDKLPFKSKSDGYAFEHPKTTPQTTTILPEPSNLNEYFAKDSKIPQPNDLDSRLYLPPTNSKPIIQPEPSTDDKSFLPPPVPQKPKFQPINPLPAQQAPVRLLPKSTEKPKLDNIIGAGAQNSLSISQVTTERQHTLEELCNDSFHSFLCVPLKPRQRFNGRLRPQAKLPPGLVLPDSSNINEENRLPAPSSNDEQRIKPKYSKPSTTIPPPIPTVPRTTKPPSSYLPPDQGNVYPLPSGNELTIIRTTKKPLIHFEPSDAFNPYQAVTKKEPKTITKSYSYSFSHTTTKKYNDNYSPLPSSSDNTARIMNLNDGYSYPKPYQPFTFPTTPTPSPTPEVYPQPSNDQLQAIRPSNGYNYPKPSNQLSLPSEKDNESPSPSNNFGTVLIPEDVKRKPKVKFTLPTTSAPVVTTRPTEPDTYIQPAAAQNPVVAVQVVKNKDDHHTLEEQCSHAFHSFLCNTPKRKRPRPDGRLYTGAPEFQPAPSNNNPERLKPSITTKAPYKKVETSTKSNDLEEPAPSSNQQQAIPFNGYNYPSPKTPFNSPIKTTTTPNYDSAPSNPIGNKAPLNNGYSYPKPSPAFNIPISTTTTSSPPEFIDETKQSGSFDNVGYTYPKPSERFPSAAEPSPSILKVDESKESESTGYSYNVPTKSFTLPTRATTPSTTTPYFDIDVRSASRESASLLQPAQNNFARTSSDGYNYPRPDTSKQLQLPSNRSFLDYSAGNPAKTNKPAENKPTPPTSISEQLPKFNEDQFPFSFFK